MTVSDYRKAFKQLKAKPFKLKKFVRHNAPKKRTTGIALFKCRRCLRTGGHIGSYGLHLCRQCFRDIAVSLGFKKYH
ncbi:MAG TPA: 30S ribosomal protein S14 [Candidatus Nanoarchaeia archaeon]|nr:30S ribosomal protein S14 [Candidatus Nanoarchaeia archaeon]